MRAAGSILLLPAVLAGCWTPAQPAPAQPAKASGQRLDGRDTRRPEHFTLLRQVDGSCVLRRESSGALLALPGAQCRLP